MSDSASAPSSSQLDTTGPYITSTLRAHPHSLFLDFQTCIVPDEVDRIRGVVRRWATDGVDLIITTGGTGWAATDVTVEVRDIAFVLVLRCDVS